MLNRIKAALLVLIRAGRNTVMDARYGRLLAVDPQNWRKGELFDVGNADYVALDRIFKDRIKETDVLVDVGCRKGRVLNWWLSRGLKNRMIGVELDAEIAEATRRRLRKYENVTIITGDILTNLPEDGTLFYLYNPFPADVMEAFKNCLMTSLANRTDANKRDVRIVYYNCKHLDVFRNEPSLTIDVVDIDKGAAFPFPKVAFIDQVASAEGGEPEGRVEARAEDPAGSKRGTGKGKAPAKSREPSTAK